jgi:hypothetical protein
MFPFSDAYDLGKDTRSAVGWSFIAVVALQVITNIGVRGYQIHLSIKKFLPTIRAAAVKTILELLRSMRLNAQKSPKKRVALKKH